MTRRKALKCVEHKVRLEFREQMKKYGVDLEKKDERSLAKLVLKIAKMNPKFRKQNEV